MAKLSAKHLAQVATQALLYEVSLAPKPGLVDRFNTGAHTDMSYYHFIDSSLSLFPFFEQYVQAGMTHKGPLSGLFDKARQIGIEAEKAMFESTQGVNTHKGANFSFALILSATGYYLQQKKRQLPLSSIDCQAILDLIPEMCQDAIAQDFEAAKKREKPSYGEKLYLAHGLKGIRGEAASGYPTLSQLLLPTLRVNLASYTTEEAFLQALLVLMSQVEDGNLIHRGGLEAWQTVMSECQFARKQHLEGPQLYQWLTSYDQTLIDRHLSPGGSADLLALGFYFMRLEGRI